MRIGDEIPFEDLPYILQDEFAFVVDDWSAVEEEFNSTLPKHAFQDDGTGYAAPAATLLQGRQHTYRVEIDGQGFVYAYSTEQWCIVGEDL